MMTLTIMEFLGAAVLASRFNVIILPPAMLFGWMVVLVDGLVTASSGTAIALRMLQVAIALQSCYVAGIVLKWAVLTSRNRRASGKLAMAPDSTF